MRLLPSGSEASTDKSAAATFLRAPFSNSLRDQSEMMESTKITVSPEITAARSFPTAPMRAILNGSTLSLYT